MLKYDNLCLIYIICLWKSCILPPTNCLNAEKNLLNHWIWGYMDFPEKSIQTHIQLKDHKLSYVLFRLRTMVTPCKYMEGCPMIYGFFLHNHQLRCKSK